jgi:tripartite-type tricarboxylate transporter receptor subunit TctC
MKGFENFPDGIEERSESMKRMAWFFAGMILLCWAASVRSVTASPYYEGKRISIIVGFAPGGGHDRMARLLAKHLPKHIPGKPSVIIDNMVGATGMIAANHIYNLAKPDGFSIGTLHGGIFFAQLLKAEGVKFDLMKYSWIGSAASEASVLCIRSDMPYKTFDDLLKAPSPIMLGTTGPADVNGQFPILLKEFAGLNAKMITYPSSSDIMLAVERKEVDGRGASYSSVKPFIERGLVRPVVRCRVSEPGIENLPVDEDLTKDKKGKTLMGMLLPAYRVARPYVAPPKTPPEVMTILRNAFTRVANDPELKEDAKKVMMNVDYLPSEECLKSVGYLLNQPEDMVKEFNKYFKF